MALAVRAAVMGELGYVKRNRLVDANTDSGLSASFHSPTKISQDQKRLNYTLPMYRSANGDAYSDFV